MDTWYATKDLMLFIDSLTRFTTVGSKTTARSMIRAVKLPIDGKVKLFRVAVSTHRTDWVVTNDLTQDSLDATQEVCGMRWKIEQFHRKSNSSPASSRTNAEKRASSVTTSLAPCSYGFTLPTLLGKQSKPYIVLKHGHLDDYLCQQLKNPAVFMRLA